MNNGESSRKKMNLGGNEERRRRSLSLEKVVVHIYSNRITLLPLAAEDNGMDKENRTNTGHCHSAQLTFCPPQAYLSSLSLLQCRPQLPSLCPFPNCPSQRLGACDPENLWLHLAVF